MTVLDARRVIESLRKGIPPNGHIREFTVGRKDEIEKITSIFGVQKPITLLLKANYGSGKTHLLRLIREVALDSGYVVSLVTLDAKSAVRFNRMDQVFGAVCRGLETKRSTARGIGAFFDAICGENAERGAVQDDFWDELSSDGKWDYSECLESKGLYVALRAWVTGDKTARDLVEGWLSEPWVYRTQRKRLYEGLVMNLKSHFRDPRREYMFYSDEIFSFHTQGHHQSWAALRDIHTLALAAGFRGLVILFDEFEDVIYNISRTNHRQAAFWNLFQFYFGKQFPGMSFFAVTPGFVEKCKQSLAAYGEWDFGYASFDDLPTFEMTPLSVSQLLQLATKIIETHSIAYEWQPSAKTKREIAFTVQTVGAQPLQDRVRKTITQVVRLLDRDMEAVHESASTT
ncbi:MAG: BREX system ATP-binding domain-containing protein [Anaerolineae bacterium]